MKKIIIAALIGSVFSVSAFAADTSVNPENTETHKAVKVEHVHKAKHKNVTKSHTKSEKKEVKKVAPEKAAAK